MFFSLFGDWLWGVGSPSGVVHNLLMQFFALYSSKIEGSETYFFDIVTTHNDQPSYVKHVLGGIYVFFTLFGDWVCVWGGGGGSTKTTKTRCCGDLGQCPVLLIGFWRPPPPSTKIWRCGDFGSCLVLVVGFLCS